VVAEPSRFRFGRGSAKRGGGLGGWWGGDAQSEPGRFRYDDRMDGQGRRLDAAPWSEPGRFRYDGLEGRLRVVCVGRGQIDESTLYVACRDAKTLRFRRGDSNPGMR